MNMKAIMFAGAGLFVSMSATAIWVGNDLADIKAREQARKAAECAAAQPGAVATSGDPTLSAGNPQNGQVLDPNTGLPMADTSATTAPAGGATTNPDCATTGAAGVQGQQAGAVDPATGQAIDPNATGTGFDPNTGQPITDPNVGVTSDPAAAGGSFDSTSGTTGDPALTGDPGLTADPATF